MFCATMETWDIVSHERNNMETSMDAYRRLLGVNLKVKSEIDAVHIAEYEALEAARRRVDAEEIAVSLAVRASTNPDRQTRLAKALDAVLPHVKLVPTRSIATGNISWKKPGIVLLGEPDAARTYDNRISPEATKLIFSMPLRNGEFDMLISEIRKSLLAQKNPLTNP